MYRIGHRCIIFLYEYDSNIYLSYSIRIRVDAEIVISFVKLLETLIKRLFKHKFHMLGRKSYTALKH